MPRQSWDFDKDVPVMGISFALADGTGVQTLRLQVDCGATGGVTCFILSEADSQRLSLQAGPSVQDEDVNGNVVIRQTDLVLVEMPTLHLRRRVFAKRYPQPPSEHQGLVTLKFLTDHFDRWGAEKDAAGNWQFYVERA